MPRVREMVRGLVGLPRRHPLTVAIVAAALAISLAFLAITLQHTAFGLPIEDGYIYLTYAKQFGRGQPFTYFPGGGYSAGSTSVIWPMLLAPFWTLGARGVALVWVSFFACAALYATTVAVAAAIVRQVTGSIIAAIVVAGLTLGIASLAFTALSGMEVAFASALLVASIYQLYDVRATGAPTKKLVATLAALALSRPEAMVITIVIVGTHVLLRLRAREWRSAARWLVPLAFPFLWLLANRLFAGTWFPNTGVAKSHFYLPGFDWTYWWDTVTHQTLDALRTLFWSSTGPFVWPRIFAVLWLAGAVRLTIWAWRTKRLLVGALIVLAPLGLIFAVITTSGAWSFHHYRYVSPAFPLLMITIACGIAPPAKLASRAGVVVRRAWHGACLAVVAAAAIFAYAPMRSDIDLYAQNVTDLNTQVVTLGRYLHDRAPDASVMFHDAGAIAYYGDTRVFDMLGLVTNHQARVANNGPGSRFEFLEALPPDERPTHFAYYPSWMGQSAFFGTVIVATPLAPPFHAERMIGGHDMQLIAARWDRAHTAEAPFALDDGWRVVDRVDVADLASEDAHGWTANVGRRQFGDPTARWSVFHADDLGGGQVRLDGGRTIRGGTERFTIAVADPAQPVRLVMRIGGAAKYAFNEPITKPVDLAITGDDGRQLAAAALPAPSGPLAEIAFDLPPPGTTQLTIVTRARSPYRVFHWFAEQPAAQPAR